MNVRIVVIHDRQDALRQIRATGADEYAAPLMAGKGVFRAVCADGVDNRAANIIKQEMLSLGGEAAVNRAVSGFTKGASRVLIMGTLKQHEGLLTKLSRQPFGLKALATEIAKAFSNYDRTVASSIGTRRPLKLGDGTAVMGILNVTPDSFSDGGSFAGPDAALERAAVMEAQGAAVIDIGGESSRPGAAPVTAKDEIARVMPVVKKLAKRTKLPLSIDTYKPEVARAALDAGVSIVNDITGLRHQKGRMAQVVREYRAGVVIMHMQGEPRTMQRTPRYGDVVEDILTFFTQRLEFALSAGIAPERIVLDPGIGFGKTEAHNLEILRRLGEFKVLGFPLLVGVSRKRFIGSLLGGRAPQERCSGSLGAAAWCALQGARIVRVHDVRETVEALKVIAAVSAVQ